MGAFAFSHVDEFVLHLWESGGVLVDEGGALSARVADALGWTRSQVSAAARSAMDRGLITADLSGPNSYEYRLTGDDQDSHALALVVALSAMPGYAWTNGQGRLAAEIAELLEADHSRVARVLRHLSEAGWVAVDRGPKRTFEVRLLRRQNSRRRTGPPAAPAPVQQAARPPRAPNLTERRAAALVEAVRASGGALERSELTPLLIEGNPQLFPSPSAVSDAVARAETQRLIEVLGDPEKPFSRYRRTVRLVGTDARPEATPQAEQVVEQITDSLPVRAADATPAVAAGGEVAVAGGDGLAELDGLQMELLAHAVLDRVMTRVPKLEAALADREERLQVAAGQLGRLQEAIAQLVSEREQTRAQLEQLAQEAAAHEHNAEQWRQRAQVAEHELSRRGVRDSTLRQRISPEAQRQLARVRAEIAARSATNGSGS